MKTVHAKKGEVDRRWLLLDAKDQVLGRLASEVACLLRGKRDPKYTPNVDTGEFVVIVNAERVKLTGSKLDNKLYYNHSGYNSGLKTRTARTVLETNPTEMILRAVRGMLPKGPLGYQMIRKLKVYAGADHPHEAQKPEQIAL
jgi:large subunit ribosomal protein L13